MATDWKGQLKAQKQGLSKPSFKTPAAEAPSSGLDAIYARLKELQAYKDEIMGDLEEFVDDVETKSAQQVIAVPPQLDEVVDMVVSDSRAKADDLVRKQEQRDERASSKIVKFDNEVEIVEQPGQEAAQRPSSAVAGTTYEQVLEKMGMGEENAEKPFWAKFLRADYMDQSDDGPVLGKVLDVLDGNLTVDELTQKKAEDAQITDAVAIYEPPIDSPSRSPGGRATFKRAPVVDAEGAAVDGAMMKKEWQKIKALE
jgi:hypothetical protein